IDVNLWNLCNIDKEGGRKADKFERKRNFALDAPSRISSAEAYEMRPALWRHLKRRIVIENTRKDIVESSIGGQASITESANQRRSTNIDYSKPSHEGYRNTIELPEGNNAVPLQSDTIRLVQNGCSFHGLRSEDPNQHLKDFLKLLDSLDLDVANRERTRLCLFQFSLRGQASNWLERLPA
ncbi:hypothetical protein Tco_1420833, partial [Tanacetum coccineum]